MKRVLVISTMVALLALLVLPALCDVSGSQPSGDVVIGDQVVLRIHEAAGGMSIQQRVDAITTRLNDLLGSAKFDPNLITVRKAGNEYAVNYGNELIVTADTNSAKLNNTSSQNLANEWAANLRRVVPMAKAGNKHAI